MLIPLKYVLDKYGLKPNGVIHVGSHYAEEAGDYLREGINAMVFIEPCKAAFDEMKRRLVNLAFMPVQFFNCACGNEEGIMTMNVSHANEGQSNSLMKPVLHLIQHPSIVFNDTEQVEVKKLDNLPIEDKEYFNFLCMDVQGYEGEVLKGATETLKHIDIVYAEINRGETYEKNPLVEDLDDLLRPFGFERVETKWASENLSWGDGVWIKRKQS
jgi:FkbM family methyltransferase